MTEETQIPECCKKYDEVTGLITEFEDELSSLNEEKIQAVDTITEYLQIIKNADDLNIQIEFFKTRIIELDKELMSIHSRMNDKQHELQTLYENQTKILKEVYYTGYVKILSNWITGTEQKWITKEEYTKYEKSIFVQRLV